MFEHDEQHERGTTEAPRADRRRSIDPPASEPDDDALLSDQDRHGIAAIRRELQLEFARVEESLGPGPTAAARTASQRRRRRRAARRERFILVAVFVMGCGVGAAVASLAALVLMARHLPAVTAGTSGAPGNSASADGAVRGTSRR